MQKGEQIPVEYSLHGGMHKRSALHLRKVPERSEFERMAALESTSEKIRSANEMDQIALMLVTLLEDQSEVDRFQCNLQRAPSRQVRIESRHA